MKQSNQHTCPKCAAVIPDEAPSGLCPKCAFEGVATAAKTMSGARKSAPPSIAEIAPHFPELEILELIGAGGMGAVYKARQPQLDRFVALKILSHDLAGDPTFVERFNREARVLARLSHPNIVGIHDFGTAGPYCFLTMELVDGVNLRQAMQAGRFTPSEALAMVQHLCSALAYAHAEGILHRDIKPENILIDSKGRVKIADFGIAKLVGEDREQDFTLTLQGSVLGSPHYMAPEQIETPGDVDQRADIYSLGVVLYEMLTGGLPLGRFALPSQKAAMDARIDHIVMRTLEKEREARYQSAGEVSTEVEALGKSPAPPAIKAAASPAEPGAARFSLLSGILTGISIIFGIIVVYLFSSFGDLEDVIRKIGAGWALFNLVATLGTAITGFILGASALGAIRKSGGTKDGLGSAIFATTAWPILVFLALGSLFMKMPSPGEGGSIPLFMVIVVVVLPVVVSAWLLVRSLYRWAGGVERKDGMRFHPGLGIPLLMAMLLAIGGPVLLAEIAVRALPAGERRDPFAESQRFMEEENLRHNASIAKVYGLASVDWERGGPEVLLELEVHPKYRAEFRLVQYEGEDPKKKADTGIWTPPSKADSNPGLGNLDTCLVFIGTTKPRGDDPEGNRGVTVQLIDNEESGHLSTETDFATWQWHSDTLINLPPLAAAQQYSFEIASREESVDGISKVTGKLVLEVQLIER